MRLIKITGMLLLCMCTVILTNAQSDTTTTSVKRVDSVLSSLDKRLKNAADATGKRLLPLDTGLLRGALPFNKRDYIDLVQDVKMPLQSVLSKIKLFSGGKFIQSTGIQAQVDYSYMNDTGGVALGTFQDMRGVYNYTFNSGLSVFEMPFDLSFRGQNGIYAMQGNPFDKLLQFNFDHQAYVEKLRKKVLEKLSAEQVLAGAMTRVNALRSNYESKLRKEIQSLQNDFSKEYKTIVALPEGISDLSKSDMVALKNKLFNGQDGAAVEKIDSDGKRRELLEKVYQKIVAAKEGFENNKLVKELKSNLPFTPDNYKSFLAKPGNLGKILDDHIDLNSVQRLFVNVTRLDIGQNAVQSGDFSLQNLINTGINTEFKSNKTSVGFIYGRNNNINNWLQAGLNNTITNEYSSVAGFSLGSGTGGSVEKSISINFFNFSGSSPGADNREGMLRATYLGVPQRRDATISFHTGYAIGGTHKIGVDVSRSFGSFVDNLSQDSVLYKANAHADVFSGSGTSNYAAMVDYTGELLDTDIRLFVKKVGMGYNNPGNSMLRKGETQVGVGFSRKWLNNKLTTRYNIDYRKQNFDPLKRYSHTTVNNRVQLSYKIRRNNRVGVTYQRSDFSSRLFVAATTKGGNARLQVDGAYQFSVAHKRIMNNVVISHQQLNVPMLAGEYYKGNSFMLMYSSTAMFKQSPLSLQVIINRSDNTDYLFNTSMFTAEASYGYAAASNVRLSSGLGYYTNTGWNRQVGGRQQLSATFFDKLNLDVEVSYRKAVHIERRELANQLFVTTGAHFNF